MTVRLKDIIDALDIHLDDSLSFADLDSGEVVTVSRELMSAAEESDEELDLPEWQHEEWELANRIVTSGRLAIFGGVLELG